jgi:Rho GTPase-activating protein RGD1
MLHLNRIAGASNKNRMNIGNLSTVFAPTLVSAKGISKIEEAGWQVRVVQTILSNTLQIFDDDD